MIRSKQNILIRRQGLSLLELLVVLTILIALGGIVVSTLSGFLGRTEVATAATNVKEIDSAIRRSMLLNSGEIGDRFDALVTGGSNTDGAIPAYVGGADQFEAVSLTQGEIDAMAQIGVTELVYAVESPDDATYASHNQLPVPLGQDSKVCVLKGVVAAEKLPSGWNFEPIEEAKYVVMGLGKQCSLVGAGPKSAFSETPTQFSQGQNQNSKTMYLRYLVLVELNPVSEGRVIARYVGVGIPGTQGIQSVADQLEGFSKEQQ